MNDLRIHVDRRGRILIENFGADALALVQALAPNAPEVRRLLALTRETHRGSGDGERRP